MTAPQDPFRTPDTPPGQPGPYGPPPGQPGAFDAGPPGAQQGGGPGGQSGGGYGAPAGPGGYGGGYGSPPVQKKNGFGVAALVLGILALVTSFVFGGIPFGIAAIVFGVLGRGRAKRGEADNGGMALAGLILGVLGLLLSIAVVAGISSLLSDGRLGNLTSCLEQAQGDPNAERECQAEFEDELTG